MVAYVYKFTFSTIFLNYFELRSLKFLLNQCNMKQARNVSQIIPPWLDHTYVSLTSNKIYTKNGQCKKDLMGEKDWMKSQNIDAYSIGCLHISSNLTVSQRCIVKCNEKEHLELGVWINWSLGLQILAIIRTI